MSYDLAISTFETRNATYVTKLYEDVGFTDIAVADMLEKPTRDSIGTAIAHKKIGESEVIAVAIRGEKYDAEWASNFIVGKEGDAKGFSDSSSKILGRVKAYISDNALSDCKIWIVGYSRAGAIADLMGVYINKNLAEFGISSDDDIYVYAFEPPAASLDGTVYDNIVIVKNKNDIVPLVYPASWGFHTNGRIVEIGDAQTVTTYTDLLSAEEYEEADVSALLSDGMGWLSSRLSRETYADKLEKPLSDLLEIFFSKPDEDRAKVLAFLTEDVVAALTENKDALVSPLWSVMSHESDYLYHEVSDMLVGLLDTLRKTDNAAALTDGEFETLKNSIYPLLRTIGPIIVDDMLYFEGIDYDEYYANELPFMKMDDRLMGETDGAETGFDLGYDAGFEGLEYDPDPHYESEWGPDHQAGYEATYPTAYADGYALGSAHAADLAAKGEYDGKKDGERNGYSEALAGVERATHNEYLWKQDWMTDEYLAAYDKAYEEAYNPAYDAGIAAPEPEAEPTVLDSYHILSVVKNFAAIIKNHHPQFNLTLVKLAGHDYEPVASVPASCTEDGSQSYHCPTCGDDLVITIPAGHKMTHVKKSEATIDSDGNIEYWSCSVCGKYFADKNGETELSPEELILKLGDVNRDGTLNAVDVITIMRYLVGYEADGRFDLDLADFDQSGSVNARDVIEIMRKITSQ